LAHPRIVFIDLSQIGHPAGGTVAELVLAEIEAEIIRRQLSMREQIPYYLYIEEFADFIQAGASTNELFAKARKNALGITLAHQSRAGIHGDLGAAIMNNTNTKIIMQVSAQDARFFAQALQLFDVDTRKADRREETREESRGSINPSILQNLQHGQAIVRLEVEGVPHCVAVSIPLFA
jgi:hypothetical protein